ncbi:MAG: hypothetical protein WC265_01200 [Dysgonamonadaceae bacterium]|jgi:transcriptional regulator with XRE-family HTH domain
MDTNSSFTDRLDYLQDCLQIKSGRSFASRIGITHGNYQSYRKGSQPTLDKLINILTSVENLNPYWLLYGRGEIFLAESSETEDKNNLSEKERLLRIIESQQRTIENLSKK